MTAATGHNGPGEPTATAADALHPEAFSSGNKLGQEAMQAWADGDVAGTQPIPVVPAPLPLADAVPRPAEGSGPWRMLRRSLHAHRLQQGTELTGGRAAAARDTPAAATSPDLPVMAPADTRTYLPLQPVAETRADLPVQPAGETRADLPAQAVAAQQTRADLPAQTVGPKQTRTDLPAQAARPAQTTPEPAQTTASAGTTSFPAVTPDRESDVTETLVFPVVPAQDRPAGNGPSRGSAAIAGPPDDDSFRRPLQRRRPSQTGQNAAPPVSGGDAPWLPAAHPSSEPPSRPRTPGGRPSAASQRDVDLARRNCLRLRCVCPDPTVCPALTVKRSPASSASQLGWQMPVEERQPAPGFTTMMSLAVASAATMPIPVMPGAPGYGFATAATLPLPVVPADAVPWDGTGRNPVARLLGRLKSDHMLRNSLFLLLSTGVQAALGFAFWIVVARLFSTEDVGRGSSLISAIGLIAYFALLGLNNAVVRYLPTARDKNSLITSTVLLVGGFGALIGAIYIFATPVFAPKISFVAHQPLLALGFVVLAAASSVNLLTDSVFIASRKASYTALTDGGVGGISKIVFSLLLAGAGAYGVFSASAGGFAAAALASLVLMGIVLRWRPALHKPIEILKPLIKFSFANYAGDVMALLPTLVVPLIILDRLGPSSEAYFFVAFQLANLLYAAGRAIEQTFLAEGSQADADWRGLLRRSLRLLVVLFVPMCLVVVVGAHWVLLVFGVKYSQFGTPTLMLLAAAAVPMGANNWLQTVLRLAGALKAIVWSGMVCAVSVCALAWFLAPYGLTALSVAWVIGSTLGALVAGIGFIGVRRRDAVRRGESAVEAGSPQRRRRRPPAKGRGRGPSGYEGRHGSRSAPESQPKRSEQPVR